MVRTIYVIDRTHTVVLTIRGLLELVAMEARDNREVIVLYYDVPDYVRTDHKSIMSWYKTRVTIGPADYGVMV
jgi:hypothetical protein